MHRHWLLALVAFTLFLAPSRAQNFPNGVGFGPGPSMGVGLNGYPRSLYWGFGYFPSQYNGFYTNGFSAYGPPVPTYGIVPGTFGANDYRLNNIQIQNGASIGLGGSGAGGAGPRRRHWAQGQDDGSGVPNGTPGLIEVRVPTAEAEVYFEGQKIPQTGLVQKFLSPAIAPGQANFYSIRARWNRDGDPVERSQAVAVRPNQLTVVDFNLLDRARGPSAGPAVQQMPQKQVPIENGQQKPIPNFPQD